MNLTWLYVAVIYAGSVGLARRAGVDLPVRVAALFYILVLAFFLRPMTGPYVNFPTDATELAYPWAAFANEERTKFNVSNFEMQDVVFQMAPWAHQVRESWRALEVPLWNGLSGCGQPLLANMQSAALSPLRVVALPLPLGHSMTAEAAMKVLLALTFTFLYCRRRYDLGPSVIGAIAFGFGTFTITWLHWPHATVAVFLPAVLYAIDLLAEARTFARFVFAAALGPMILFGGHPETTGHIVFFATLYALWVALVERTRQPVRFIATLAAACVVAAMLAAPLLWPFLESMPNTVRYQDLQVRPHIHGTAYSDFSSLVPLFQPRFYGTRPGPAWSPNAIAETISGFAGILGVAAWFGLLARALRRRELRSRETFFVIATLLIFALIDDWPIVSDPFRALFHLALNARLRLIFCLLAAFQTAALVHHARRERMPLFVALAGGIGTLAILYFWTDFPSEEAKRTAVVAMVPSVAVLAVALTRIPFAIAAILFVELWFTSQHWNPVRPLKELYPRAPLIEALLRERGDEPFRIAGVVGTLFPNTHALFGLEDARVHDAMANARYAKALAAAMPYDALEYYPKFTDPDAPILDDLNVKWLVTDPGVDLADRNRYRLLYDGVDGRMWENRLVKPRFVSDGADIEILKAANADYTLRVDARHDTTVRASIAFWPGWRVTYDGRRLDPGIIDGAFLGFVVPPGSGIIRIRYQPITFWGGLTIASITLLMLAIAGSRIRRGRRGRPFDAGIGSGIEEQASAPEDSPSESRRALLAENYPF